MAVPCTSTVVGVVAVSVFSWPARKSWTGAGVGAAEAGVAIRAPRTTAPLTAPRHRRNDRLMTLLDDRDAVSCGAGLNEASGDRLLGDTFRGVGLPRRGAGQERCMRTRRLDGLTVPALGLGCMGMSEFYGT